MVRTNYRRPSGDPLEDLDVNVAIWGVFTNATLKAAVHLGNDRDVNLRHVKNSFWRSTGQLFGEIEKLISGQTETAGIRLIDSEDFKVGINKLIAQSSLSMCHCQGLCLLRLLCSAWEKWETILLNPRRNKFNGTQKPITSAN